MEDDSYTPAQLDDYRARLATMIGLILLTAASVVGTRLIMGPAICNLGYDLVVFGALMSSGLFAACMLRPGGASTNSAVLLGMAALGFLIATGVCEHRDECLPTIEDMGRGGSWR